jgi:Rrf2 family protein
MRFTAQEEYGLRCMLQMARHEGGKPLTITNISELEGLTPPYVGKLMHALRQNGLVKSIRGQKGGYHLAHPAKEISLDEIFTALGGRFFEPGHCERYPGQEILCVHTTECSIRSLWGQLDAVISEVLKKTSLADLARTERLMGYWLQSRSDAAAGAAGGTS